MSSSRPKRDRSSVRTPLQTNASRTIQSKRSRRDPTVSVRDDSNIIECIKFNTRLIKYLYDNKTEFVLNQSTRWDMPGNFTCRVVGYSFLNKLNDLTLRNAVDYVESMKYTLEFTGYITYFYKISDQIDMTKIPNKTVGQQFDIIKQETLINDIKINPEIYSKHTQINEGEYKSRKFKNMPMLLNDNHKKQPVSLNTILSILKVNYLITALKITRLNQNKEIVPTNDENLSIYQSIRHKLNESDQQIYLDKLPKIKDAPKEDTNNRRMMKKKIKIELNGNQYTTDIYYDPYSDITEKFFTCNIDEIDDSKMKRKFKFLTKKDDVKDNKGKVLNVNLKDDFENERSNVIENAKKVITNAKNKNKNIYITHNIQNKESENGVACVLDKYKEEFLPDGFSFIESTNLVILFQEAGWKSLDETIYGKGDFMYTNCEISNGSLMIDLKSRSMYGNNTYRRGQLKNSGSFKYFKTIETNYYEKDENIKEYIKKNVQECIDIFSNKHMTGGVRSQSGISYSFKNTSVPLSNSKSSIERKYPDIVEFFSTLKSRLRMIANSDAATAREFWTKSQMNFKYRDILFDLKYIIENREGDHEEIFENIVDVLIYESVYLHPQVKILKYDLENERNFAAQILVHDMTDDFNKGAVCQSSQNDSMDISPKNVQFSQTSSGIKNNMPKLFAISCDERMNFEKKDFNIKKKKEKKTIGNDKKQLCTIFSSEFFDPRLDTDETHVLLIAIETSGDDKNHVALVIADNKFEEIVINVHLESGGQGVDTQSHQYALSELNILLNNIVGNKVHPFFEKHKDTIKNIRIFSDFNLTSNAIATKLINFSINKKFKEYKFSLLLDRIKTHDSVKIDTVNGVAPKKGQKIESNANITLKESEDVPKGCIDNVIYITNTRNTKKSSNINKIIIGSRKLKGRQYKYRDFSVLSDHSPIVVVENDASDTSAASAASAASASASLDNSNDLLTKYQLSI
jgi:hypothetical protein